MARLRSVPALVFAGLVVLLALTSPILAQGDVMGEWFLVGSPPLTDAAAICPQIGFSPTGVCYVAFQDYALPQNQSSALRYDGGAWTFAGPRGAASVKRGWYNHVAFDPQGRLYVAARDYGVTGLGNVRVYDPATDAWSNLGAPIGGVDVHYTHIVTTPSGVPYVVYQDSGSTPPLRAVVKRFVNGQWTQVGGDVSDDEADYPSLALVGGEPWVAYSDASAGYAATVKRYDAASNQWKLAGAPGESQLHSYNVRLAVSPAGVPHYAYIAHPKRVYVRSWTGSSWDLVAASASGSDSAAMLTENWRQWLSLAFDAQGRPLVGYQDMNRGNRLTVRRYEGGTDWRVLGRVGFTPHEGDYYSMAMAPGGEPWVVVRDGPIDQSLAVMRFVEGVARYCQAKVNSSGTVPKIALEGTPTLTGPDDFHVTATHVPNQQLGVLLWSFERASKPFAGGRLCLGGHSRRTDVQSSGGAASGHDDSGVFDYHWTQTEMQADGLYAGSTVYTQYWFRDPQHPDGTDTGLSAGLEIVIRG